MGRGETAGVNALTLNDRQGGETGRGSELGILLGSHVGLTLPLCLG